uniref:Collagen type XX alpha 1 chain n=1 Tax=Pongo abelii TaxID=9601 RepID=A0A8I5TDZ7_PONAB
GLVLHLSQPHPGQTWWRGGGGAAGSTEGRGTDVGDGGIVSPGGCLGLQQLHGPPLRWAPGSSRSWGGGRRQKTAGKCQHKPGLGPGPGRVCSLGSVPHPPSPLAQNLQPEGLPGPKGERGEKHTCQSSTPSTRTPGFPCPSWSRSWSRALSPWGPLAPTARPCFLENGGVVAATLRAEGSLELLVRRAALGSRGASTQGLWE